MDIKLGIFFKMLTLIYVSYDEEIVTEIDYDDVYEDFENDF